MRVTSLTQSGYTGDMPGLPGQHSGVNADGCSKFRTRVVNELLIEQLDYANKYRGEVLNAIKVNNQNNNNEKKKKTNNEEEEES